MHLWTAPARRKENECKLRKCWMSKEFLNLVKMGYCTEASKIWIQNFFLEELKQRKKELKRTIRMAKMDYGMPLATRIRVQSKALCSYMKTQSLKRGKHVRSMLKMGFVLAGEVLNGYFALVFSKGYEGMRDQWGILKTKNSQEGISVGTVDHYGWKVPRAQWKLSTLIARGKRGVCWGLADDLRIFSSLKHGSDMLERKGHNLDWEWRVSGMRCLVWWRGQIWRGI